MTNKLNNKGFTIIELLIATSVFASVLFIVTYGIIQISRMYTNGFVQTQTQNTAITIADTIARDLQFTPNIQSGEKLGNNYWYFCTTKNEYFYIPLGSLYEISLSNIGNNCTVPDNSIVSQAQNLLPASTNMEIINRTNYDNNTSIMSGNGGLYSINVDILYGTIKNLTTNNTGQYICKPTVTIGPFCSIYILRKVAYTQN
jgi:prepilin-type N-terminal cleavage/methylation domain-containing protein